MFFIPKAYVKIDFNCPYAGNSPEAEVLTKIFVRLLMDYLNEYGMLLIPTPSPLPSQKKKRKNNKSMCCQCFYSSRETLFSCQCTYLGSKHVHCKLCSKAGLYTSATMYCNFLKVHEPCPKTLSNCHVSGEYIPRTTVASLYARCTLLHLRILCGGPGGACYLLVNIQLVPCKINFWWFIESLTPISFFLYLILSPLLWTNVLTAVDS